MYSRFRSFSKKHSFFLFGPRGVGKSTLLKLRFDPHKCLWLNLLEIDVQDRFLRNPSELYSVVQSLPANIQYVVIDEIQKAPKLLDEVHRLIEDKCDKIFILTGSSARKLKKEGTNLLAGRAFVYHLYPLSCFELENEFRISEALQWGTLPKIFTLEPEEKKEFLRAYADTYLKEEIVNEQVVRRIPPFRHFLEVAAQCNGKIINYANIARDVGVDDKTIKEYFSILEDTLIGFFLNAYHSSFRKRLIEKPKFYFFDPGVVRALSRKLSISIEPKTTSYGDAFEHFIILECIRLSNYFQPDYRFSFARTVNDVEIDLIIERPEKALLCIEIKSSEIIHEEDIASFIRLTKDMPEAQAIVLSQDRFVKKYGHVTCFPWKIGLEEIFPEVRVMN